MVTVPKGVYERTAANKPKPRIYPPEIIAAVRRMYIDEGMTVAEVQAALPKGYKAQRIIERHIPVRRTAAKRDQSGDRNHMWKGDAAGYSAAHLRVAALRGSAREHACIDCGSPAHDWSFNNGRRTDLRDPETGCAYSNDPNDYDPRCRSCHRRFDRAHRGGDAA